MLLLLTAHVKATSTDSLGRAFDNCVFLYDSLSNELTHAKEIASLDSANIVEHQIYISILETQLNELSTQKEAMQSIIDKQAKDNKNLLKSAKKQRIKSNLKLWLIAPASAIGGGAIGFIIGKFLY